MGGVEILPDGYRTDSDAEPIACVAVTDTAPRIVYEPLPVLEAARLSFFNWDPGVATSGADAAAVRMSTGDGARAAFDEFAGRWRQCDGSTVVKHLPGSRERRRRRAGPGRAVRRSRHVGHREHLVAFLETTLPLRTFDRSPWGPIVELHWPSRPTGQPGASARGMAERGVHATLEKVAEPNRRTAWVGRL